MQIRKTFFVTVCLATRLFCSIHYPDLFLIYRLACENIQLKSAISRVKSKHSGGQTKRRILLKPNKQIYHNYIQRSKFKNVCVMRWSQFGVRVTSKWVCTMTTCCYKKSTNLIKQFICKVANVPGVLAGFFGFIFCFKAQQRAFI